MIHWMSQECDRTAAEKEGKIIFDEMTIQPGIQLEPHQDGLKMFGYVDCGPHNNGIHELSKGSGGLQLATSVLQFVFLVYNGFRFPVAYMLAAGINTGQLVSLFWDLVNSLKLAGFFVSHVCIDGVAINRAFVNLVCGPSAPVGRNIVYSNSKLSCIMDFSRVVKKIRIILYASGVGEHHKRQLKRQLKTPIGLILWKHFQDAYQWDNSNNLLENTSETYQRQFLTELYPKNAESFGGTGFKFRYVIPHGKFSGNPSTTITAECYFIIIRDHIIVHKHFQKPRTSHKSPGWKTYPVVHNPRLLWWLAWSL